MARRILVAVALLVLTAGTLAAHDLFLRAENYFVTPNSTLRLRVLNGTFNTSENAVARNRLRSLSLITPAGIQRLDTAAWSRRGKTSALAAKIGESGTYVVGASLHPSEIKLEAKDFNAYLASDGIPDVLESRRRNGELGRAARERYSKHVKAVVQAGSSRTNGYSTSLGYPAEIIPLDNPYTLKPGGVIKVRTLVGGMPISQQLVIAGGMTASGTKIAERSFRTDSAGVGSIPLRTRGVWYVKFIHMQPAVGDTTIDYESKWATLTFAIR
jgi:uncharacterized GH25 family protein